ncbi:MAG: hypothetical protein AVDCRST_MAG26-967 [uncultured Chloroflexia bacterium]|uniref:Major facilitator superfamily (MFS) profile domain-containing protein n=1 Tax=uncultured Chloroflexia bacterium TaxID=1672391 RepID=A0A6J4HQ19_9CHLR|nr:MAG: hypothetical protein AVDCRST_MAG26-967 [uncultured Chloroflexia bacterium]
MTTLHSLRRSKHISLGELARCTGVPLRSLAEYEYEGRRLPEAEQRAVAAFFGLAPEQMTAGLGPPTLSRMLTRAGREPSTRRDLPTVTPESSRTNGHPAPSSVTSGDEAPVGYRTLLANRNFRRLWLGQAISTWGSYFTRIAIPIYVWSLTGSYAQLGLAAFASLLASLSFGLVAGALADRWDRRRVLIGCDLAGATLLTLAAALAVLPLSIPIKLGTLYVITFLAGMLRELFTAARVAIFPEVLTKSELLAANSLDQGTATLSEFLSYPLAGLTLFYLGPVVAFGVDAASFLVSALLLLAVRAHPAPMESASRPILAEIATGLRTVQRLPTVRKIILLSLVVPALFSLFNTLQLPYAVDVLGSTEEAGFPALEAATALGLVLGALVLGRHGQHVPRSALLGWGIAGLGVIVTLLGLLPSAAAALGVAPAAGLQRPITVPLLLALPLLLLVGGTNSLVFAGIRTLLQEQTPREVLGRVASVMSMAAGSGFAIGALLAGVAQGRIPLVITLIGAALIAIGLFARWWLRRP